MGAITAAVIGAGTALYTSQQAKKQQKEAIKASEKATAAADPYSPYRVDAAERLSKLMDDPSSIEGTASYKARLQAAERTMAAQGYTGSGNAAVAAADAAGQAYQQEFNNLALVSGAGAGLQTAAGVASTGLGTRQDASNSYLTSVAGVGNNLANIANTIFNKPASPTFAQNINSSSNARFVDGGP